LYVWLNRPSGTPPRKKIKFMHWPHLSRSIDVAAGPITWTSLANHGFVKHVGAIPKPRDLAVRWRYFLDACVDGRYLPSYIVPQRIPVLTNFQSSNCLS